MSSREPFYEVLGRRIRESRNRQGLTQERLGKLLQPPATRASIANIEKGSQRVLAHTLVQLAAALKIEIGELARPSERKPASKVSIVSRELAKVALPSATFEQLKHQLGLSERSK